MKTLRGRPLGCLKAGLLCGFLFLAWADSTGARQALSGHRRAGLERLQPVASLEATNQLQLGIGLPWRDQPALARWLGQVYDPASPFYRQYLTPDQFTARYGPTERDYQALIFFARSQGLTVTGTHSNRMMVNVQGSAAAIEKMLRVSLKWYPHPREARSFFAPDREPSLDLGIRILHVSGLDNYVMPRPMNLRPAPVNQARGAGPNAGSGPNGTFWGKDFRAAYVPGTSLTGTGQVVGLFELNGYYASDITTYESRTGLPNVPLQNVLIDGFNGSAGGRRPGSLNEEVALDIEMAISMAPGLTKVVVYEGSPTGTIATINNILNRMATDNIARQLSCSWGFDIDENTQQIFQQYAAQGQSFFLASGDSGAFSGPVDQPSDNPFVTVVGGTALTTDASRLWASETAWNGSGGGISTVYPLPEWQAGLDFSTNQGSADMRNTPDVAMVAANVLAIADRGQQVPLQGTSIAAPLWAGFMALVNEQAAALGKPPAGFINPAVYAIGKSSSYLACFHDITTGDNTNPDSPNLFLAVPGYDLCTGWGTPAGTNLINALVNPPLDPLRIAPPLGFSVFGPAGGPFNLTSLTYQLTNAGTAPIRWSLGGVPPWLSVSATRGSLLPGAASLIAVSLNPASSGLLIGSDSAALAFKDLSSGVVQERQFSFSVGNGDFESGDFKDWAFTGDTNANFADSIDFGVWWGGSVIPGVADAQFVHSGLYGAFLGQTDTLASLSQTLPTVPGRAYQLSFWLDNPASGAPNQFRVSWDDSILFDQSDLDALDWTNLVYTATATSNNSVLKFEFRNDQNAFGLDDIAVRPVSPSLRLAKQLDGVIMLRWNALAGLSYQVQYASSLSPLTWTNLGDPVTASESKEITVTEPLPPNSQRFYRVILAP